MNLFEMMMSAMADEFPTCSRVHADWEFVLTDKTTGVIKNTKKFRIIAIQNDVEQYQHVAIIISELSHEYAQLPDLVKKFLSEVQKVVEANTNDHLQDKKMLGTPIPKFTGNVYLYADKLLVSEDAIRKHFEKNGMVLQSRVAKKNLTL